ncbi:MAG: cation-translocating P-type ATPase [Lachnospiraceae bacterium]|nr:cation-translocating P-type ATPase [Lachnospiraceae bacterium]MCI9151637.1 cation-translocating P-type ATPase [Lachnospiraceae bacterium]
MQFTYKSIADTATLLESDRALGLTEEEAEKRLAAKGPNQLAEPPKKHIWEAFFEQLADPLIYVLLAAAAVSLFLHEVSDTVIILVVVLLNAVTGLVQEGKAQKALDSLKKLTSPRAVVIRRGREREIEASRLVAGDVVVLSTGALVPADLRLMESQGLKIEESALTGESVPVEKDADFSPGKEGQVHGEIPLGDRRNMAYMSTMVTSGRGLGMVCATGMETEIGRIAAMIHEHKTELTPLQKKLGELGKLLSFLSLGLCVMLFFIALFQKRDILEMLMTAISLAVAAVPEGLPAVVTICLALSVTRMVRVNTIIRRLPSVETLGAVSVVCSDKTGTLTQNKMTVTCFYTDQRMQRVGEMSAEKHQELLYGMTLCNDGLVDYDTRIGEPTELALLDMARQQGLLRGELEKRLPRIGERAFDSRRKMMSTAHSHRGEVLIYTKGAPDVLLGRCSLLWLEGREVPMTAVHREKILEAVAQMSSQALRTLALARRTCQQLSADISEEKMTFVGIVGMEDPARPEAAEAVAQFRKAGVATVMITGDHVDTAFAIASQLGIAERLDQCLTGEELQRLGEAELTRRLARVRVFARVSPEHKVKIVRMFQKRGDIVAMTGDGVNDAPSLRAADVGISMGMGGTDVARQASDMILTDDNFATIRRAIEEGRGVYENIKKSVIFLLSSNLGELITMFLAVLCGLAAPLKSSHILWINLITDSLPALALGVDRNDGSALMRRPPRKPGESLFAGAGLACTCFYGLLIGAISLTAFLTVPLGILEGRGMAVSLEHLRLVLGEGETLRCAQTYAFTVLGMSQLFHAVGMRNIHRSVFRMNHMENKLMIAACLAGFLLQLAVTLHPALVEAFQTVQLSWEEWLRLTVLAAFPMLAHEIMAALSREKKR